MIKGQTSSFIFAAEKLAPSGFCPEKRLPRYACAEFFSVQKSLPPIFLLHYGDSKLDLTIKYVKNEDKDFWFKLDRHLPQAEFEKKVRDKQGYVLFADGSPVGILRYNLFWDNTPFCNMLFVDCGRRQKGYGSMLLSHWEKDMKAQGYGMLLTSTQVDESAQHFYRKQGYKDCGGMVMNLPGFEQPMEMFLCKALDC